MQSTNKYLTYALLVVVAAISITHSHAEFTVTSSPWQGSTGEYVSSFGSYLGGSSGAFLWTVEFPNGTSDSVWVLSQGLSLGYTSHIAGSTQPSGLIYHYDSHEVVGTIDGFGVGITEPQAITLVTVVLASVIFALGLIVGLLCIANRF